MTVNYHKEIMASTPWTFFKLLFKWKGSIWKAVYIEMIVFLVIYYVLSIIYRTSLSEERMRSFEAVVRFFSKRLEYIPLELVLGFFCTQVLARWTKLYQTIGFIDNVGLMTALYVRGRTEKARTYRRNIMRYSELVQVLVFRDISMRTRRRFPTLDTVVAAGFMLPEEKELYESYADQHDTPRYWIPANWALDMTYQAWKDGYIESAYFKAQVEAEIRTWRTNIEWVFNYDWVPYPLIWPQVVCLAVHLHFFVATLARQIIAKGDGDMIDVYFPFMTFLQFLFYMGWLKVIEAVLNPFGEDDDDFETNALIDRNITMGLKIVDDGYDITPEVRKDPFFDDVKLPPMLYSEEAARMPNHPYQGSVSAVRLNSKVNEVVMVPHSSSECNLRRLQSSSSVQNANGNNLKRRDSGLRRKVPVKESVNELLSIKGV
ncbi:unnamed protein product [Caenorhabditis auriculariae]|uniref:Bestrophin homolog n=1 Tax=Caenorhabditis auriculariae TaxID=2777116 RepID=A0A8S1HG50_9PELO|nr:unnamed protein product [Caenorhabditis auriculariae]